MVSSDSGSVRSGLATVTVGTLLLALSSILLVVFSFLSRVLIVRSVAPSEWTAFSLGLTVSQVLLSVGGLGLTLAVPRSLPYARDDTERRQIVRTALGLGVSAAAASALALALLASPISRSLGAPLLSSGLVLFAVATACLVLGNLIAAIFQGFSTVTPNALFLQIVNPGLFLGFLAVAVLLPPGHVTYLAALLAYAASAAATLLALVVYLVRRLPFHGLRGARRPEVRSTLLHLTVPLFVSGVMASVASYGDTLVLGAFHYAEVGTYTASLTFARLVQIGMAAASYIFLPVASGFLARQDRRAVRLTYVTVTKWLTVFSLPLFVVFVFLPSSSLDFVYGSSYARVVLPLQVLVAGAFGGTLLGPAAMALVAGGGARLVALNSIAAGVVDVAVSFALVPAYGAVGAAEAWSVANLLYGALCLGELGFAEGYHPFRRDFLVPLAGTAVPVCAVLVVLHPQIPLLALPLVVIGVAVAFVLVVIATGSVDEGDRLLLEAVERMLGRPVPFVRRWAALRNSAMRRVERGKA